MARRRRRNPGLGVLPLVPIIAGATGLATVIGGFFGQKAEAEALKEQAKAEAKAQRKIEEQQRIALEAARRQQTMQFAIEQSQARRREQMTAMYVIGGVAVVAGVLLLRSALKKRSGGDK